VSEPLPDAALVLTRVAVPEVLAAGAAINRVAIDVVPTAIGCVAVCRTTSAGAPEAAADLLSRLVPGAPVVLLIQRDGQVSASRWQAGVEQQQLSAALMLDGAPPEIEGLLLVGVRVADLPGVVSSAGMSRWRAARTLASAARTTRRLARAAARDDAARPAGGTDTGR
jgi:hypothetical protein